VRDLPAAVRAKAVDLGATAWLKSLPELIATLAARWDLRLGAAFPDPTEAYVVEVTRGDGTPAVLKLLIPRPGSPAADEITFLREADGEACARLLAYDKGLGVLLLERLGPALSDLNLPISRRLPILCDLAAAVWRPTAAALPTGPARALRMSHYIRQKWTVLGEPCSRAAVDQALAAGAPAGRRADARRRRRDRCGRDRAVSPLRYSDLRRRRHADPSPGRRCGRGRAVGGG
jgi:streptomycin 6-kinase